MFISWRFSYVLLHVLTNFINIYGNYYETPISSGKMQKFVEKSLVFEVDKEMVYFKDAIYLAIRKIEDFSTKFCILPELMAVS